MLLVLILRLDAFQGPALLRVPLAAEDGLPVSGFQDEMELPRRRVPEYVLACHLPAPRVDEYPGPASRSRTCSRSRPFPPCGVASVADAWPCCRSENYIPSQLTSRKSRSEEHTSELQSLMRTSYAVFCFNKK